jgi:hypothetical protein
MGRKPRTIKNKIIWNTGLSIKCRVYLKMVS